MNPKLQKNYSLLFLIAIFSVLFSQILIPEMEIGLISEKYLWKENLISRYRKIKYLLGDRVFPITLVGKDGWLFYTGELSMRNYQKDAPLNVSNIKKLVQVLEEIHEKVEGYGGTFLVVVAPDKSTIYPQFMPDEIPVIGDTSSLDRLLERVDQYSDIQVLDLRHALRNASKTSQTYYKTDTHWNCLGAFYVYQEIFYQLQIKYKELNGYSLDDFDLVYSNESLLDISKMTGIDVKEKNLSVIPKFDANTSTYNPSDLMIIHDSFYLTCLNRFMESTFEEIFSMEYKDVAMTNILQKIEDEKPEVVVVEFVERYMEFFFRHFAD